MLRFEWMNEKKWSHGIWKGELEKERERKKEDHSQRPERGDFWTSRGPGRASPLLMDDELVVRLPKGHSWRSSLFNCERPNNNTKNWCRINQKVGKEGRNEKWKRTGKQLFSFFFFLSFSLYLTGWYHSFYYCWRIRWLRRLLFFFLYLSTNKISIHEQREPIVEVFCCLPW